MGKFFKLGFSLPVLALLSPCSSCQRHAAEAGDHGDIKAEVIPPAGVDLLIDVDVWFEQADDQRNRRDPAVPDAGEEVGGLALITAVTGDAPGEQDGGAGDQQDDRD